MNEKPSRKLAVFAAAIEFPTGERVAFVARECGDDPALKARIEALLRADTEVGNFLESPQGDARLPGGDDECVSLWSGVAFRDGSLLLRPIGI